MTITKTKERIDNFGEVYTPTYLVNECLKHIPDLSDPDIKILEPSCGNGQFVIGIIDRLLVHHDIKYIIENIIYAIDIQSDNIDELKLRLNDTYNINVDTMDHNLYDYDSLMTKHESIIPFSNELVLPKFDLIISNPPYNINNIVNRDHPVYTRLGRGKFGSSAFMLHYADFLKPDGRSFWLIPVNILSLLSAELFRTNITLAGSITDIWTYDKPVEWKHILLPSLLGLMCFQKAVGLPYSVNDREMGHPVGGLYYMPKNQIEYEILKKYQSHKTNKKLFFSGHQTITKKYMVDGEIYKGHLETKDTFTNISLRSYDINHDVEAAPCINGINKKTKDYNYCYCKPTHLQDITVPKVGFVRIIHKHNGFDAYEVPLGYYAANTDLIIGDPEYILYYLHSKAYNTFYQIMFPSKYANRQMAHVDIWEYNVDPYEVYGFNQEEIDYIENLSVMNGYM